MGSKSQKVDLDFGFESEDKVLVMLREYFGDSKIKKTKPFCPFDFKRRGQFYVELKTRRINKDRYRDVMVKYTKLEAMKEGYDYYFSFHYLDGLYMIKYNKELFDTFTVKPFQRLNGRIDYNDRESLHLFIPTNLLFLVKKL